MPEIKAFKGWRPKASHAKAIASVPYDVISSKEARELAQGNPHSFLHVIKPEIDLPLDHDPYGKAVYDTGKSNFENLISEGLIFRDNEPSIYLYQLQMGEHIQTGILALAAIEDYFSGKIKIHELTRPVKEEDRKTHVRVGKMHAEPVFFAYPSHPPLESYIASLLEETPMYGFQAEDGIFHRMWRIHDSVAIDFIITEFDKVPASYVADGHHRTAAAALVGKEMKENNPNHTGEEGYNYFMAVHFPDTQLYIMDYNRVVKDLNGLSPEEFLQRLSPNFEVQEVSDAVRPEKLHELGMYLKGTWYKLTAKAHTYDPDDPIKVLDVSVLSRFILEPLFQIIDLRRDKRIDFVGGMRGLQELEKRVDSGEMKVAFSMYPVSMGQLIDIADAGMLMPPKTTWFEPKLRSGLVVNTFG
ncbi:MAG: DUF1015 family protein [Bacteroidota bacterium]